MAGIYIHIPFCTDKCYYCDFYSGNQLYLIDSYVNALVREIEFRADYLKNEIIDTIYFGGGTPSLLTKVQFFKIFAAIQANFIVDKNAEISVECNPENISAAYVDQLLDVGINRLSLGVQFLDDNILKKFNRNHTKYHIYKALETISNSCLLNFSIDLIFSVPGIEDGYLRDSLISLLNFDIKHFSAYNLSISKNSRIYWRVKNGQFVENGDDIFINQYYLIKDILSSNGFVQYEVSNYSKVGFQSRHNLAYWNNVSYVGLGVSAHSYNLTSRQWNILSVKKYIGQTENGKEKFKFEIEYLTDIQIYNEYIILRLRTFQGLSRFYLRSRFPDNIWRHFDKEMHILLNSGHFLTEDDLIFPKDEDLLISDYLAKKLMY